MDKSAADIAQIVEKLKGTGVRKVKIGDIEIEFDPAAALPEPTSSPSEKPIEYPPELQEQSDEQMALYSSPCYSAPVKK